ncbi:uncharacterized protein [Montipora foliosa]|uniref:uncharacterized protein n=1 Tax=Montipora foliosa TaxID=591990 RepID=UPI0035F11034
MALRESPARKIPIEKTEKVVQAILKSSGKIKSQNDVDITQGILEIVSAAAGLIGEPQGMVIRCLCQAILLNSKQNQPSVVDQLAKIVDNGWRGSSRRLQYQKYDGISCRVSEQIVQLQTMTQREKLDDPNLWNDYVQFMGELSNTFEMPLTFKYSKGSLTGDPEVVDYLTALTTYCKAYSCFMGLLMAAKARFEDLGQVRKSKEVDRILHSRREDAIGKLSFLSDRKYLKFLGSLPCEGGKLMKILALSRQLSAKNVVEAVRNVLGLTQMPDMLAVESAAEHVSHQSVKIGLDDRHQIPPGNLWERMKSRVMGPGDWVQFVNETDFPIKVVLKNGKETNDQLRCINVLPRSSYLEGLQILDGSVSILGYLILYLKGGLGFDMEPPTRDAMVIEFALSKCLISIIDILTWLWHRRSLDTRPKINVQDKTHDEFTFGEDTYNLMKYGEVQPFYFSKENTYFMVKAEIVQCWYSDNVSWRFIAQQFDPLEMEE